MTKLSEFSNEDRALLVSVPYRVGIWISSCDDNEKTGLDDKREQQALELAIRRMATLHRKMPFAADIMKEVQAHKNMWKGWQDQSSEERVLDDTQKALEICRARAAKEELKQYKQAIWQIGLIVAQSFGEQIDPDNEMHLDRFMSWIGSFVIAPKLAQSPENMSEREKTALKKLRAVLKQ